MDILLTFTGFHDPYSKSLVDQVDQPGPILSLLTAKHFDHIILFSTENTKNNTEETIIAVKDIYPSLRLEVRELSLEDPTNYLAILKSLRLHIIEICEIFTQASFYISVSSGTPTMHACWVLLAASGEIPAQILQVRPPKFVTKNLPVVSVVDFTSPEFPIIRSNIISQFDLYETSVSDIDTVISDLSMVGDHPSMRKVLEQGALLASSSSAPILLLGETGTGKDLFARYIHRLSDRATNQFVPINCAAIPTELVESILFGHKRGAFTGAMQDQIGKFDLADGGTLFLDELAELPVQTQAKLLRVLQDGFVEPLGEGKTHQVDVRIIAATNQNVRKAIRDGKFREDLYYRLNVGEIQLPPLRKRRSDIPKIALSVLDRINATVKRSKRFSPSALLRLQNHSWPGNIRDLENVIERSVRLAKQDVLGADDLMILEPITSADPLALLPEPNEKFSLKDYLFSSHKQLILRALEISNGNQSHAAKLLDISPQAVHKFLKQIE